MRLKIHAEKCTGCYICLPDSPHAGLALRSVEYETLNSMGAGLWNADLPTPLATHNLAEQLLLWRNPQHLRGVMCAGRWLLRDGQVVGADEEAVRLQVARSAARLWSRKR